jgi:F-box protein 18 (helicase)
MCDNSDDNIGMLHDGYLKLYQLSNPLLRYDCILLDEAQDTNPVTREIVFSQCHSTDSHGSRAIILVGDSHQQIYSFRGARDTLKKISSSKTLCLTKSFRFDNNIARVANMVLDTFKSEDKKIIGTSVNKAAKQKWNPNDYTIIARTNAMVFKKAIQLYKKNSIGFVGGIKGFRFNMIGNVYNLLTDKHVSDNYIRSFGSYSGLKSYAQDVEDFELLSICKVVEEYKHSIPNHIKRITEKAVEMKKAEIILTTAHKAKGLEWNNILMMDDFQKLVVKDQYINSSEIEPDEFNLIYVTITRAVSNLRFDKNSSLPEFIKLFQSKSKDSEP